MSWSTRLILVFVSFGLFMSYMIYRCMNVPVNLVSKAYYKDELAYQDVIDAKRNTLALTQDLAIQINNEELVISFPEQQLSQKIISKVLLYNPQQLKNDKSIAAEEIENGEQKILLKSIIPGRYIVKIDWKTGGKNYYAEKVVSIP